jgi:hypothetical protein
LCLLSVDSFFDINFILGEKLEGEFHEIKGKKIMGVGLGNIFEGGPIKLRNTGSKKPAAAGGKTDQVVCSSNCVKHQVDFWTSFKYVKNRM